MIWYILIYTNLIIYTWEILRKWMLWGYPHFRKPPCINYMYTCNTITVNSPWPGNTLLARATMPPPQANEPSLLRSGWLRLLSMSILLSSAFQVPHTLLGVPLWGRKPVTKKANPHKFKAWIARGLKGFSQTRAVAKSRKPWWINM